MKIWVGNDLMLSFEMVICFCCYFFIHEVNRLINTYKDMPQRVSFSKVLIEMRKVKNL